MSRDKNLIVSPSFGNCNLPLAFFTLNFVFIDVNREAARILGFTREELLDTELFNINNKEQLNVDNKELQKLLDGKLENLCLKIDFPSKSGRIIALSFTVSLLELEDSKVFIAVFYRSTANNEMSDFLSSSYHNFGQISNLNPDIHYILDIEREKYIYQSIPLLNYCGYLASDLQGEKEIDFLMQKIDEVNIQSQSNVKTFFKEKKGIEEYVEIEYRILTKYNGRKWLRIKTSPLLLLHDKQSSKLTYGLVEDVTDSKKWFELERSKQKLSKELANHSTDVLYLTNLDSKEIIYTNFGERKFLGYSEKEWCDPKLDKLSIDFKESVENHLKKLTSLHDDAMVCDEVLFRTKEGKEKWVLLKSKVFSRDNHLVPYLILSSAIIIDEYKAGFQNLSLAQSTTNAIVKAIPDMLLMMDRKGNYLKAISGVSFEKSEVDHLVGKNAIDVLPSDVYRLIMDSIETCLVTNEVQSIEFRLIENGNFVYFSNNFSKLNNNNVLILVRNITKRKLTEIELEKKVALLSKKNEQLEQFITRNTELERFAYIISHDLKEPLRSINSMAEIINQQIKSFNDKKLEKLMQHLMDSSTRMNLMIEGVLDYSRLDSHIEEHKAIDLNLIVQDVLSDLDVFIQERKAVVEVVELSIRCCISFSNFLSLKLLIC
ncbi:MAG: PAS domain S-box protein [Bacteroidetes bacterium]|nr:PAS domain S-box protein [Bacteroidota bacterium]